MRRFAEITSAFSAFILCFLFLCSTFAYAGTTIHVPADQPTIQAGINAAVNGDIVLVSPGTYYENINFNGKAITVTSSGGPQVTIIDGSGSYGPTVTFASRETIKSVLAGFVLQNGVSEISISNSSPLIRGNVIVGSTYGGISNQYGAPVIENNLIAGNSGDGIGANTDTGMKVVGNVIADNENSGINSQYAGGVDFIQQNTIVANSNTGLFYFPSSVGGNAQIVQNLIYRNGGYGANLQAPFTMISNTISGNNSGCCGFQGEVFAALDTAATLQNNLVISESTAVGLFCQSWGGNTSPILTNNDVFSAGGAAYGSYCADPTGTDGNLSADPAFVDVLSDDFHLQANSPAIKAGTISAVGEPKADFDGDPRIVNNSIDIGADQYASVTVRAVSASSLHFGNQNVSTTSAPQTITLANNGQSIMAINLIATGPNFSQTNTCGTSLAAGANCKISISFSPLKGGSIAGVLGVFTGTTLNPEVVNLIGAGLAPQIQFGCCLFFENQMIGTTSTQTESVTNSGQAPLLMSGINYSGSADFVESNNCPISPNPLAIGASCTLTVSYTPTIIAQEGGSITITSNAGQPQVSSFYGSSYSAGNPVFSPSTLTFPTTLIGQSSAAQTVTLSNAGTGPLGIYNIYSYGDFPETNNCPASLAVNASCTILITYTPSTEGVESGSVNINTDTASGSTSFGVTGTGQAPVPSISSLSLSATSAGSSDTQVTITGTGFVYGNTQVELNGTGLNYCCTYFNGSTQLTFTIPAANLAMAGTLQISVFTPAPGGGTSNSVPFTVYTPLNYGFESTAYNYRTFTGTNLNLSINSSAQITSPFPIQFGGGSFRNLTVSPGGMISFDGYSNEYPQPIPSNQFSTIIAPFWDALYPFGTGNDNNVFWEVTGSAPNRQLVVEWRDLGICCERTNTVRFEVVFFEGSGNILFNYANTVFGGAYASHDKGATASVGMQSTRNLGTQFSYLQAALSSTTAQLWYPNSPTAMLSSSTVNFGYHQIGSSSLAQAVSLTNGALVPLNISSISTNNPDFTESNNCGTSLAPRHSCSIHVFFKPSQPTNETATLTIADNAANSPQTVSLTGTGTVTGVVVFPILVNFGSVTVNTSATAPVTLANATNQALTIQQISTSPAVYTETNNCGTSLGPGQACTVSVSFTPMQLGSIQGALSMTLNGKASKIEAKLTGSGK
jgi:hypothetical protein